MRKIALITLLLITCISGAAFAQEATPQFCGTLSQEDCAILTQSQQAMAALDSASFDAQIDLTMSNLPDISQPVSINITGSGSYGGLNKLRTDVTAAATDPSQLLVALLTDLNADLTITIDLPPATQAALGMAVSDSHIVLQERFVDGIGYVNMDTLQTLMRNSSMKGWYGLDLANFLKSALQQMPELFNNSMNNMGNMQDYQQTFQDPAFINRFLKVERSDDGSTSTATFDYRLNMGALMGSHEMQDMMRLQMQMQNRSMTEAELDQAMAASLQLFKGMDITLSQEIDTTDGYLHSMKGSVVFDTSGMMATMGTSGSSTTSASTPAPKFNVDFSYSYSNFNDAPEITAPPNPVIIPYQSLLRGLPARELMPDSTASLLAKRQGRATKSSAVNGANNLAVLSEFHTNGRGAPRPYPPSVFLF